MTAEVVFSVAVSLYLLVGMVLGWLFYVAASASLSGRCETCRDQLGDAIEHGTLHGRDDRGTLVLYAVMTAVGWLVILPIYLARLKAVETAERRHRCDDGDTS